MPLSSKLPGSIYDVAKNARVSIGTVSRVFNNRRDVADATRARVLSAAKRVRYLPKISARRVSIGLLVQELEQANQVGFISNVFTTMARHVASRGAVLELLPMDDLDAVYRNYLRGVIAVVFDPDCRRLTGLKDVPVVMINNRQEGPQLHSVASDHAQGARMAAKHLLDRGHRRIGFLEVRRDGWGAGERERGFREAHDRAGVRTERELIRYVGEGSCRDALHAVLKHKPTALLLCGEDLSLAMNQLLLHELKIRIPEDLSVISYEIAGVTSLLTPPQTAVLQPWEEIGRAAVEGILGLIGAPAGKRVDVMLPNSLIERGSVTTLR
jgi:LacI family transcriptional regulator